MYISIPISVHDIIKFNSLFNLLFLELLWFIITYFLNIKILFEV